MDGVPGWHAHRRAKKEYGAGRMRDDEEDIGPMQETFIGGFHIGGPSTPGPEVPPKDGVYFHRQGSTGTQTTISTSQLSHMSAIERSNILRVARMTPHLQFMVGPLLKYDTIDERGTWYGAALIVTADSGSIYDPHPMLTYEWDPYKNSHPQLPQPQTSQDLGPHPADPHSTILPALAPDTIRIQNGTPHSPTAHRQIIPGQEIYVYAGQGGTFTFWRFLIEIPLASHEMAIKYSINGGQQLEFFVPGRNQNMRWAAHSCNGFSAGVNPDDFRGPGFKSGYDPVWIDLLAKHAQKPFHALVGGGDQLYCDSLVRESELQEWISAKPEARKTWPLTEELKTTIDRFFFNHYCQSFRRGAFARANCSIPMLNMCDDHDLIDGFGSYPDDLQRAPVFQTIGARGYFFFLLFQCFINPDLDGHNDEPQHHVYKSIIIGDNGPYVRARSHSFLTSLGPNCAMLLLDCRGERKKEQVCSPYEYKKVFERLSRLSPGIEHLVVQIGIPIAYPRMVFLETALESKLNPLVALGKSGSMGLSGFVNKFNADAELLDDLNDHWTARSHKKERNWFVEELQKLALAQRLRISFLSGDVHCAAIGVFKTLRAKNKSEVPQGIDHRYMINVTTSAIVNTPPPNPVIALVSSLATKVHKTMHHIETDETMLPLFEKEPNGTARKQKFIMGRRNWCSSSWDEMTGDLVFDIRVEKEKGVGETEGYICKAPPPGWQRGALPPPSSPY